MMASAHFDRQIDVCLTRIAAGLEPHEDLDYTLGDGLLTIDFDDGIRFVVNRQAAARQVWLAAGARAWHYDWDDATQSWVDDRDGHDLYTRIAEVVSAKLGTPVRLD